MGDTTYLGQFNDTLTGEGDPGGGSTYVTGQQNPGALPGSASANTSPSSGGFNIADYLPTNLGGNGSSNMQYLIPAMAAAGQQYKNAGDYTTLAEKYSGRLDPFGSQRAQYAQQLSDLYADPSKVAQTPGYQFALSQGLGATNRGKMATTGGVANSDDIAYASGLASQTFNTEANRLAQLAGSQFGPSAAAGMLQTGMLGSIGSRNAALSAMMFPFSGGSNNPVNKNPAPTTTPGMPTGVAPPPGTFGAPPPGSIPLTGQGPGGLGDQTNVPDNSMNPFYAPGNDFQGGDGSWYDYIDQTGA